jgi:hypothetical protein
MTRGHMLDEYERHTGVRGQMMQQSRKRLQPSGGGADRDDRESWTIGFWAFAGLFAWLLVRNRVRGWLAGDHFGVYLSNPIIAA